MIDKKIVQEVSRLAHLKLEDEHIPELIEQFSGILEDFKCLESVDTQGIEPMISPISEAMELREDLVKNETSVEEILANAPEKKGTLFKVPPAV